MSAAGVGRDELAAYLDGLLGAREFTDLGPNGLQVEGRERIRRLVTGVSACRELFELAAAARADAVLVHHGLFWKGLFPTLTGVQHARVAALFAAELSLYAYHLPLDAHPELGNNALAARRLGLTRLEPFGEHGGRAIGWRGRFPRPVTLAALVGACRELFGREPEVEGRGPERIESLGIVSGGAQAQLHDAIAAGLDAYLTGETSEWVMNLAREAGIHYLAAGHYATETLGVRALGDHLAERFGLEVDFLDVPNPV